MRKVRSSKHDTARARSRFELALRTTAEKTVPAFSSWMVSRSSSWMLSPFSSSRFFLQVRWAQDIWKFDRQKDGNLSTGCRRTAIGRSQLSYLQNPESLHVLKLDLSTAVVQHRKDKPNKQITCHSFPMLYSESTPSLFSAYSLRTGELRSLISWNRKWEIRREEMQKVKTRLKTQKPKADKYPTVGLARVGWACC